MPTILKGNLVFLHIPKTGGTWVKKVLESLDLIIEKDVAHEHSTYAHYSGWVRGQKSRTLLERLGRKKKGSRPPAEPTFFCVVRNPITWYESWFKFQIWQKLAHWGAPGVPEKWHVMSALNDDLSEDFNEFVANVNRNHPGFVTALYSMYAMNSGARVLHLENIRHELADLLSASGLPVDPSELQTRSAENASPSVDLQWNKKLKQLTIQNEMAAFRGYGYDPE
jgi:hypothetical protein